MPTGFRVLTARSDGWHWSSLLAAQPCWEHCLQTAPANSTSPTEPPGASPFHSLLLTGLISIIQPCPNPCSDVLSQKINKTDLALPPHPTNDPKHQGALTQVIIYKGNIQ